MRWEPLGLIPVATAERADISRSALGRVQIEAMWLPTVLLEGITIPTQLRVGWFFGSERFETEGEFFRVTVDHGEVSLSQSELRGHSAPPQFVRKRAVAVATRTRCTWIRTCSAVDKQVAVFLVLAKGVLCLLSLMRGGFGCS